MAPSVTAPSSADATTESTGIGPGRPGRPAPARDVHLAGVPQPAVPGPSPAAHRPVVEETHWVCASPSSPRKRRVALPTRSRGGWNAEVGHPRSSPDPVPQATVDAVAPATGPPLSMTTHEWAPPAVTDTAVRPAPSSPARPTPAPRRRRRSPGFPYPSWPNSPRPQQRTGRRQDRACACRPRRWPRSGRPGSPAPPTPAPRHPRWCSCSCIPGDTVGTEAPTAHRAVVEQGAGRVSRGDGHRGPPGAEVRVRAPACPGVGVPVPGASVRPGPAAHRAVVEQGAGVLTRPAARATWSAPPEGHRGSPCGSLSPTMAPRAAAPVGRRRRSPSTAPGHVVQQRTKVRRQWRRPRCSMASPTDPGGSSSPTSLMSA